MRSIWGRIILAVLSASLCLTVSGCSQSVFMDDNDGSTMTFVPMSSIIKDFGEIEEPIAYVQEIPEPESDESSNAEAEDVEPVSVDNIPLPDEFEPVSLEETIYLDETEDQIIYEEPDVVETITYTIDEINKSVYTITDTDVRSGPADYCDVIGTLMSGTEVAVSGVCEETGWYRTSYNGSDAYFDPEYTADAVTSAQPESESQISEAAAMDTDISTSPISVLSESEPGDSYVSGGFPLWNYSWHSGLYLGRLRIPSVEVNVAIYNDDLQSTVDAVDSAIFVYEFDIHDVSEPLGGTIYCGDHNIQGFNAIANCTIGCEMYIDGVDGNTYKYICDRIDYNGINTRQGLKDSNGNTLDYSGWVWCYTCHDDSDYYIYEVHFVPV